MKPRTSLVRKIRYNRKTEADYKALPHEWRVAVDDIIACLHYADGQPPLLPRQVMVFMKEAMQLFEQVEPELRQDRRSRHYALLVSMSKETEPSELVAAALAKTLDDFLDLRNSVN